MEEYNDARAKNMIRSRTKKHRESEMVLAMVENAKESSWQENIDNAIYATRRFTLGDADGQEPEFVKKIRRRATAMYAEHRNDSDSIAAMHRERRKQAKNQW